MTSTEAWWRDKTSMTLSGLVVGGLWSEARFCGLRNLWRVGLVSLWRGVCEEEEEEA